MTRRSVMTGARDRMGRSGIEGEMSRVADPKAKITLLRAAEEVFAERGVAGAKVEEIARRAGVSKGAFYLHFESKEAALEQLLESFLARCQSFFGPPAAYPSIPDDADALLDFMFERDLAIYEFLWQSRALLRILPSCQNEHVYLVEAFRADIGKKCRQWVDHLRHEGFFRDDVDADLAAVLIGGAYHDLSLRLIGAEKRPDLERWLEFALETFSRAFGTETLLEAVERRNRRVSFGISVGAETSLRPRSRHRLKEKAGERGRIA
ncbi:MAG: helix-turn-helix transcriptional regulator [Deltaproteobacteria bacterium]|nr:helix-turn-helix transcriptional regulator [Deltaproteobacteria bacterium]